MKTMRQIPRGDAWTQIAILDTGEVMTESIAELAGEIQPDIMPGRIGRIYSRWRFVRSKRIRQYALPGGFLHVSSLLGAKEDKPKVNVMKNRRNKE